jgi:hypothetical protein
MLTEPTVFILGAGASVPYGYPTGRQLRGYICKNFLNNYLNLHRQYRDSPKEQRIEQVETEKFVEAFNQSGNFSIDLWLARNTEFSEIGKKAILTVISKMEHSSKFNEDMIEDNQKHDWYSYLFNRMTNTLIDPGAFARFNENKVGFVTFNYDRSLEFYLQNSLKHSFMNIPRGIGKFSDLISFPIHHVYGLISKLSWQDDRGSKYRSEIGYEELQRLQSNIRVIHERTNQDIDAIKDLISGAKRIFFLGFGYAQENLEALDLPNAFKKDQQIFGTAIGFTEKERRDIIKKLRRPKIITEPIIEIKMDCLTLLREYL